MAIGWRHPLFLRMAIRMAPQRWSKTVGGAQPEARRFTRLVREERRLVDRSSDGQKRASRRLGRRPDGPGAVPGGNDLTPFVTMDSSEFIMRSCGLR